MLRLVYRYLYWIFFLPLNVYVRFYFRYVTFVNHNGLLVNIDNSDEFLTTEKWLDWRHHCLSPLFRLIHGGTLWDEVHQVSVTTETGTCVVGSRRKWTWSSCRKDQNEKVKKEKCRYCRRDGWSLLIKHISFYTIKNSVF